MSPEQFDLNDHLGYRVIKAECDTLRRSLDEALEQLAGIRYERHIALIARDEAVALLRRLTMPPSDPSNCECHPGDCNDCDARAFLARIDGAK